MEYALAGLGFGFTGRCRDFLGTYRAGQTQRRHASFVLLISFPAAPVPRAPRASREAPQVYHAGLIVSKSRDVASGAMDITLHKAFACWNEIALV